MAKMSVSGIVYTSPFGPRKHSIDKALFHYGADYGPPKRNQRGVPLYAIFSGPVRVMKDQWGANGVRIGNRATEALEMWHFDVISNEVQALAKAGRPIQEGTYLGDMGDTGQATGVHVHVEHWVKGKRIDPVPFINKQATKPVPAAEGDSDHPEEDDMYTTDDRARDDKAAELTRLTNEAAGRMEKSLYALTQAVNRIEVSGAKVEWGVLDSEAGVRRLIGNLSNGLKSIPGSTVTEVSISNEDLARIEAAVNDGAARRMAE